MIKESKGFSDFSAEHSDSFQILKIFLQGKKIRRYSKALHQTIKKVEGDIENLRFNTAISAMMIFLNLATKKGKVTNETADDFYKNTFSLCPSLSEKSYGRCSGHNKTLAYEPWPCIQ